jgi:TRAP-type C4-dicarboxylate transport system substrate-binding protein
MRRICGRAVVMSVVVAMLSVACSGSDEPPRGQTAEPSAEASPQAGSDAVPIPEGQSLMDPGSYLARVEPAAVITTTTPWYGAANVPGFVDFGQLDEFPYAELYFMNLQEVVADPSNPGVPLDTIPAPDDLFAWFVESTGAETVGEPVSVEIDGYAGQQADLRVGADTPCAPKDERPFPQACLPIFPIGPDAFPFAPGMAYRLTVLPDVEGQTVTILYADDKDHFAERVQVAQEVVNSIDFVDAAPSGEVAASEALTLTLGVADARGRPDTPVVEHFAEQVGELSDGALSIEIEWAAGGDASEQGVVERVETGSLDLGWTATRVWDTFGVPSFQALQAPFLITDHAVLHDVLSDPIASDMLAGLEEAGFVGLGLYPDQLRHPLGYAAPLRSLDDWDGAKIRLLPSEATDALVRSLGGESVYGLGGDDLDAAIASGEVDGTETSFGLALEVAPSGSFLTGNVVWFPRVNALVASDATVSSLSEAQREVLEEAASETFAFASEVVPASDTIDAFCSGGGQLVAAEPRDLEALERAARPVYATMERDRQTASFIERIRELKGSSQQAAVLPTSCEAA